jgi:hypothetical protein
MSNPSQKKALRKEEEGSSHVEEPSIRRFWGKNLPPKPMIL